MRRTAERHKTRLEKRAKRATERIGQKADSDETMDSLRARVLSGVWKTVQQASDASLDNLDAMHQLRITVKRLRYAMEIFAGCYDPAHSDGLADGIDTPVQATNGDLGA